MGDPVSLQKTGSRASPKKPSWGTFFSLFLILLMISPKTLVDGQLIGSRGVFTLPEGMEYRDALTRDASRVAADFAMNFQVKEDMRVKEKYKKKSKAEARKHSPFFGPKPLVKGRPLTPNEVLDFRDSRFLNPPEELRMNKILPEVEMERTTSSIRLLMDDSLNPPKNVRPPPKQFPTFEAVRTDVARDMPKQFTSFDAVRSKPDSLDASRTNKDARMQFPTFEAVPTPVPSKQRKMGPRKDGGMKKQRFMGVGGNVKPRKNQQQVDRRPQSFQRFMSMQAMDHAGRKEPDALQRIFPIENEVTRSRSKPFQSRPLMGAKLRPPQRTFEQEISPGRKPSTRPLVVAPNRMDKGERPRFDSPPLDETRLGFQRATPGPQPFMSPPPPKKSRMRSRQFGAKPNGFRPSPPLNSVNPIDGGRPFIQSASPQLHQNLGPGPSGFRSGDEFGLVVQQSPTPQSHRGASLGLGLEELKRLPAAPERSRSQQSSNLPSRLQQLPKPPQALQRPSSRFRQFGDREPVTGVEELKHEPSKPLRPRHRPTAQPIFQVFAQQRQPIQDLSTNSLDDNVNLISSSSPAPPVSFKLGRLKGGGASRKGPFRKNHGPRPVPTPIRVSSPRPRVFDRTPSSLTDINSNAVSSNVFGRKSTANFLVQGPNYSISWGR